jgi:hypothetical protein
MKQAALSSIDQGGGKRRRSGMAILPPLMVLQWKIGWSIYDAKH